MSTIVVQGVAENLPTFSTLITKTHQQGHTMRFFTEKLHLISFLRKGYYVVMKIINLLVSMWKMKIIKIVELKQLYNKRMLKLEVPKFERNK